SVDPQRLYVNPFNPQDKQITQDIGSNSTRAKHRNSGDPAISIGHNEVIAVRLFRFSSKWRSRSPSKVKERTHEEATEALRARRESRHPEAAFAGEGAHLKVVL